LQKNDKKSNIFSFHCKKTPDFPEIAIGSLGVVIGAHTGPGLLAVFYYCGERKPM